MSWGGFSVSSVKDRGPAALAGIQIGDELIRVDGASLTGKSQKVAAGLLRGPIGSAVSVTVRRRNDAGNGAEGPDDGGATGATAATARRNSSGDKTFSPVPGLSVPRDDSEVLQEVEFLMIRVDLQSDAATDAATAADSDSVTSRPSSNPEAWGGPPTPTPRDDPEQGWGPARPDPADPARRNPGPAPLAGAAGLRSNPIAIPGRADPDAARGGGAGRPPSPAPAGVSAPGRLGRSLSDSGSWTTGLTRSPLKSVGALGVLPHPYVKRY